MNDWSVLSIGKAIVASAVAYWIGMSAAIQTLLGLMVLDFATGVVAGMTHQQLNSKTASKGVARKAGALIIIIAVHLVSDVAGNHFGLPVDLGNIVAWFYVMSELISIVENCARLGAPVPKSLVDALRKAQKLQETADMVAEVKENQAAAAQSLGVAQKVTEVLEQSLPSAIPPQS